MNRVLAVAALAVALVLLPASAGACEACSAKARHAAQPNAAAAPVLAAGEERVVIPVEGMSCGHCASRIETALGQLDGVKRAQVKLEDAKVIVVFEKAKVPAAKLVETIDSLGYKAGAPVQG